VYNPSNFEVADLETLHRAIADLGAAQVVTFGVAGIESSTIPVVLNENKIALRGHFARANPQWKNADSSISALAIWSGPNTYVSPNYYPSKQEHGKVVPTWNYITVQVRGKLTIHDDPKWTKDLVRELTDHHEKNFAQPWSIDDAPKRYIDSLVKTIVGFEIEIATIEGKWKLSQNRPEHDSEGVVAGLHATGANNSIDVAQAMVNLPERFDS
jgi:transcriptional regulator